MSDNINSLYLVMVEPNANNNKYYRMIPNGNYFDVQFGRVGVSGYQTKQYPMSKWESTLKSKIKKGYVDQTRLVAETIIKFKKKEYIDINNPCIAQIVSRLQSMARQAIKDNYTVSSKAVTQVMIDEAQLTINNLIKSDSLERFNKILVELFKIIPRKMGKVKDYLATNFNNLSNIIQREQDLLDVMRGQVVQNSIVDEEIEDDKPIINQTILEAMGLIFEEITDEERALIKKNLGSISNRFYQAWKVVNIKTQERFDKFVDDNNIKDKRLLWHGSRSENFWSIINTGLVLRPNAVITGKMFGHGVYYAPKATKSLGYTSLSGSYWSHGTSNSGFMALMDVAYGNPYEVYDFSSKYYELNYDKLQQMCKGANCLHAKADKGMLKNDEIVCYLEEQSTIKYLVELK